MKKIISLRWNKKFWSWFGWVLGTMFALFLVCMLLSGVARDLTHIMAEYFITKFGVVPFFIGAVIFLCWCGGLYVYAWHTVLTEPKNEDETIITDSFSAISSK